ncbi:hypothetical protein EBN88_08075, partial [Streptomyces triticirhizae]
MNASRPGEGAAWDPHQEPYAEEPYPAAGERPGHAAADPYQAAVDALDDPLGDPLPGQRGPADHRAAPAGAFDGYPAEGYPADAYPAGEYAGGAYPAGEYAGGEYPHETYDYESAFDVFAPRAKEADPETMGLQVRPPRREHDPETVGLRRPEDLRRLADEVDAGAGSDVASGEGASGAEGGGRAARRRAA